MLLKKYNESKNKHTAQKEVIDIQVRNKALGFYYINGT